MLILLAAALAVAARDYRPAFDPSRIKPVTAGVPNQVLVLGTPHLSEWKSFDPGLLGPLLDRLGAWRPQLITVEAVSGPQCDAMRHYPARYSDTVEGYCWDPAPAHVATGKDVPAATAEVDRLLASWPADPAPAARRHLAALFLAAGDQTSALVQWLRLPAAERQPGDGLNDVLVARLEKIRVRPNEDFLIAAVLAARLGLERVTPVDDHSADFTTADDKAFGDVMTKVWDNPAGKQRQLADQALKASATTGDGMLALYRAYNMPDQPRIAFDSDFGAALQDKSPQQYGRMYEGMWEVRNLRMVANIREALAMAPGKRLLAIVGASHKGYFEAYLDMMHDVHLVDAGQVLR